MPLLLDQHDVATLVDGPTLMLRIIDVIEGSFRDIAAWDKPRDPTVFPWDMSIPKMYTVMGSAPSLNVIGGCVHLRGGPAVAGPHSSYKMIFDLETGDLLCMMEDGPVHRYMHGADIGVATRWLAREDATSLGVVTSGPPTRQGLDPVTRGAAARALIVTNASIEAICAVRPIERVRIYCEDAEHGRDLARTTWERLGVEATPVSELRDAVTDVDVLSLSTNNSYRGAGTCGVRADWLSPGTHVNSVIREEVDAATVRRCKLFPASIPDLYAIEPVWEPYVSVARSGQGEVPAGLDEVVAKTRPGRVSADDITMFTGASIGAQHTALAAWVYGLAVDRGVGTHWEQRPLALGH